MFGSKLEHFKNNSSLGQHNQIKNKSTQIYITVKRTWNKHDTPRRPFKTYQYVQWLIVIDIFHQITVYLKQSIKNLRTS